MASFTSPMIQMADKMVRFFPPRNHTRTREALLERHHEPGQKVTTIFDIFGKEALFKERKRTNVTKTEQTFEPWVLETKEPLATGVFGVVYKTRHKSYPKLKAVTKVGNKDDLTTQEIAIAMYVGATGVGPLVFDAWSYTDNNYMVMEQIRGQELGAYLLQLQEQQEKKQQKRGANPVKQKSGSKNLEIADLPKPLLIRLQRAITALEDSWVQHEDLHDGQFLITKNGQVKIIDFGQGSTWERNDVKRSNIGAVLIQLFVEHVQEAYRKKENQADTIIKTGTAMINDKLHSLKVTADKERKAAKGVKQTKV